jgi:hypothetical protein
VDPESDQIIALFHPRKNRRAEHFEHRGGRIEGLTPMGRATVHLLRMNDTRRVELRGNLPGIEESI